MKPNPLINSKGIGQDKEFYYNGKGARVRIFQDPSTTYANYTYAGGWYQNIFLNTYQKFIPACDFQMTIKPVI